VKNKRYCYRNGVILTNNCDPLLKGQVVEIVNETVDSYMVRVCCNSPVYTLNKKDVLVN
jgi:hypothetical protein